MKGIADTGFLVAFINADDQHHDWAVKLAREVSGALLTCEPVLTEAAYLLRNTGPVLDAITTGLVSLNFDLREHHSQLVDLAQRYADRQPDLCDLCVIRMSEIFPQHQVITTDVRDFRVYRRNRFELIPTLFPTD